MKCRLPRQQETDFIKIIEDIFSRTVNSRTAHYQASITEEELPEILRQIYAMSILAVPHIENLSLERLSNYAKCLYNSFSYPLKQKDKLTEEALNSILPSDQLSAWWYALTKEKSESAEFISYCCMYFCCITLYASAESLVVAESIHTALICYLESLKLDSAFVTGGAVTVASKCGCQTTKKDTLLADLLSHKPINQEIFGDMSTAGQKRKWCHHLTGRDSSPKQLPLAELNSWYITYLASFAVLYPTLVSAQCDAKMHLNNVINNKEFAYKDYQISNMQHVCETYKESADRKTEELTRMHEKYAEISKAYSEQTKQPKSLTKKLESKPLTVVAKPEVAHVVVEKSKDCTAIIDKQRSEIAELSRRLDEALKQQQESDDMIKMLLSNTNEHQIETQVLSSEDKQLLKCIRAHFVMPDFKAFRQLKVLMPGSTFEFVPKESIGKLVVPKSKELYLFCTSHAGHSVYESWFKQVALLAVPHIVFNSSNINVICHLVLDNYKKKVLHI